MIDGSLSTYPPNTRARVKHAYSDSSSVKLVSNSTDTLPLGNTAIHSITGLNSDEGAGSPQPEYRLYKRRFAGLAAIVILNMVTGMGRGWFGPISEAVSEDFGISLDQVNWLGNIVNIVYLVVAPFIPFVYRKMGIRWSCLVAGVLTLLSSWLRVLGTIKHLSSSSSYALMIIAQAMVALANVLVEVLGTKFSQTWFDARGRTTATMAVAVSVSVGKAIGSLIAPAVPSTRVSIVVLAVIGTVGALTAPLVGEKPPTPPTFAALAVQEHPITLLDTGKAFVGMERDTSKRSYMTFRQRIDFAVILLVAGVLSGNTEAWGTLSDQILDPYGYSSSIAGLTSAILLISGLVFALILAPLLDRVFKKRMALVTKILCPIVGLAWLSLVWDVRPDNTAGIFAVMAVIGGCSLPMLPIAMELCVEVTRNAEGSSACVQILASLFGIIFVQIEDAIRAGPNAKPPFNLTTALIFAGVMACAVCWSTILVEGKQMRRDQDEAMQESSPHP